MKKDRLTERDKYGHAYFPECFEEPCLGYGCEKETCEFMMKVCEKLAKYEETKERHGENAEKVKNLIKMLKTAKRNNDMVCFVPGHSETKNMIECLEDYLKIKENAWIPVSEMLPEESLDSVIGWDIYRNRCCFVQYLNKEWILGNYEPANIVAWMPLPEPYKEE